MPLFRMPKAWKHFLASAACLLAAQAGTAVAATSEDESVATIDLAYRYALPLYEVARAQTRQPFNTLVHLRNLSDHTTRLITTPNNDTLYSSALLDLTGGPIAVQVPAFGERYYSLAFIDAYTNNFAIVGTRTAGGAGGRILLVGPGWRGTASPGVQVIRAPTPQVWLLVRILIDGPQDLAAVHGLQDAIVLTPQGHETPQPVAVPQPATGESFVEVVNHALAVNPPPPADAAILARIAQVGVGAGAGPLSPALREAWNREFPLARQALIKATEKPANDVDGWSYSSPAIGDFGTDYTLRAVVALRGLLALPQVEAIYTVPVLDAAGAPLSGAHRYRLHLPAGAPPARAFWSLSAYEAVADGGLYFADNPLHRYSVGDRTPGVVRNADGSLDLLIQHDPPADRANWLPVVAGRFVLVLRAYLPGADLQEGRFHYPPLERLD